MAEYVYGVVRREAGRPSAVGVGGARPRLVAGDGAAALVSDLDGEDLQFGPDELRAHMRVLADAFASGTVLPMRFGVVMDDAEDVRRRLLERHAAELQRQLEALADKVEIKIRATYEEEPLMREVLRENADISGLRDSLHGRPEPATYYQRIELGERIAGAIARKRVIDGGRLLNSLAPVAVDVELGQPAHERIVLNASFLVARERLTEFDQVLEAVAEAQAGRMRFKYTGPLAPHSFVQFRGEM